MSDPSPETIKAMLDCLARVFSFAEAMRLAFFLDFPSVDQSNAVYEWMRQLPGELEERP